MLPSFNPVRADPRFVRPMKGPMPPRVATPQWRSATSVTRTAARYSRKNLTYFATSPPRNGRSHGIPRSSPVGQVLFQTT